MRPPTRTAAWKAETYWKELSYGRWEKSFFLRAIMERGEHGKKSRKSGKAPKDESESVTCIYYSFIDFVLPKTRREAKREAKCEWTFTARAAAEAPDIREAQEVWGCRDVAHIVERFADNMFVPKGKCSALRISSLRLVGVCERCELNLQSRISLPEEELQSAQQKSSRMKNVWNVLLLEFLLRPQKSIKKTFKTAATPIDCSRVYWVVQSTRINREMDFRLCGSRNGRGSSSHTAKKTLTRTLNLMCDVQSPRSLDKTSAPLTVKRVKSEPWKLIFFLFFVHSMSETVAQTHTHTCYVGQR